MVKLPGGFSPIKALQQTGSILNPSGGVADYNVFSDRNTGPKPTGQGNMSNLVMGYNPAYNKSNPAKDDSYQNGLYGTGGGGGASYDPADLAYIDAQEAATRRQYGKADTSLSQGLKSLLDSYNNARSDANFERGRELENLDLKTQDTTRAKDQTLDRVNDNARTLAESLRRRIGMASGSDSSAYKITAPGAVAREASGDRAEVMEDFGTNFRNLDLTKRRATEDYDKLLQAIDSDKMNRERALRTGIEQTRMGIDEALQTIAAERARLQGGGYDQVRSALAPFEQQIAQRDQTINSLFDKYRTVGKFNPVKVNTPQLRDYMFDKAAVQVNQEAGTQDPYSPYRPRLQDDEEQLY